MNNTLPSKNNSAFLSPAFGRILDICPVRDDPGLNGAYQRISIFLSLWDDHTNTAPTNGEVEFIQYTPGRFHFAFHKKMLSHNENNLIGIRSGRSHLAVRQIAGQIARRIVCDVKVGQHIQTGQPIGRIKFGSCVQLYLPRLYTLKVRVGQKVIAGQTILAEHPLDPFSNTRHPEARSAEGSQYDIPSQSSHIA